MREKLLKGTVVELNHDGNIKKFMIDEVIGDGANCIAYDAHRIDSYNNGLKYRIKECYPFNANVKRKETELVWNDDLEKKAAFERLKTTQEVLVSLQNSEALGNHITKTEIYEGHGTLYSVMEVNYAKTYANDKSDSLITTLETISVLSEILGALHEKGYVHLDLKPENFLVTHKPNTSIWLFDLDSLTALEDIRNGVVRAVPYSQKWAAPEQLRGQLEKIGPATDIYAIGAMLFERIMQRPVDNNDLGLFVNWHLPEAVFEDVNPKAKRLIKNVFKKTLSATAKHRFQNTEELVGALKEIIETVSNKPFLFSEEICNTVATYGRHDDLERIDNLFEDGTRVVILHGERGVGKSTIARMYAQSYSDKYDVMKYLDYGKGEYSSIEEWLTCMEVENYEDSGIKKKRKVLSLLDSMSLVVIDDFNIELGEDNGIEELLKSKAKILVTTNTDFNDYYGDKVQQLEVGCLETYQLLQLFAETSHIHIDKANHELFLELAGMFEYNTYMISILANHLLYSGKSLESLVEECKKDRLVRSSQIKIIDKKVGKKTTLSDSIKTLYNVLGLSNSEKQVLMNLFLIRFVHVDRDFYRKMTLATDEELNVLNSLLQRGLLRNEKYKGQILHWRIEMHSIVEELVRVELKPNHEKCTNLYLMLSTMTHNTGNLIGSSLKADHDELINNLEFICRHYENYDNEEIEDYIPALRLVKEVLIEEEDTSDYFRASEGVFKGFIKKIESLIQCQDITEEDKIDVNLIVLCAWYNEAIVYSQWDNCLEKKKLAVDNVVRLFNELIILSQALVGDEKNDLLDRLSGFIEGYLFYDKTILPRSVVKKAYKINPAHFYLPDESAAYYNLQTTSRAMQYMRKQVNSDVYKPTEKEKELDEWVKEFVNSDDKVTVFKQIIKSDKLSDYNKINLLDRCLSTTILEKAKRDACYLRTSKKSASEWKSIEKLIYLQQEFLLDDDIECTAFVWNYEFEKAEINEIFANLMLDKEESAKIAIEYFTESIKNEILKNRERKKYHWSYEATIPRRLETLLNELEWLERYDLAIELLQEYLSFVYDYAKKQDDFEERLFYDIYSKIEDFAENIFLMDLSKEDRKRYWNMEIEYLQKMEGIVSTTAFKTEEKTHEFKVEKESTDEISTSDWEIWEVYCAAENKEESFAQLMADEKYADTEKYELIDEILTNTFCYPKQEKLADIYEKGKSFNFAYIDKVIELYDEFAVKLKSSGEYINMNEHLENKSFYCISCKAMKGDLNDAFDYLEKFYQTPIDKYIFRIGDAPFGYDFYYMADVVCAAGAAHRLVKLIDKKICEEVDTKGDAFDEIILYEPYENLLYYAEVALLQTQVDEEQKNLEKLIKRYKSELDRLTPEKFDYREY